MVETLLYRPLTAVRPSGLGYGYVCACFCSCKHDNSCGCCPRAWGGPPIPRSPHGIRSLNHSQGALAGCPGRMKLAPSRSRHQTSVPLSLSEDLDCGWIAGMLDGNSCAQSNCGPTNWRSGRPAGRPGCWPRAQGFRLQGSRCMISRACSPSSKGNPMNHDLRWQAESRPQQQNGAREGVQGEW